jgi:hypothetical protein
MTITLDDHPGSISSFCVECDPDMTMTELAEVFRGIAFLMGYDFNAIDSAIPEERFFDRILDNEL